MSKLRDPDPALDNFAKAVADQLDETDPDAIDQINRAIQVVGMEKVCALVTEANEQFTGPNPPKIKDGSRQRTLGGCFFELLKGNLNTAKRHKIFPWVGPHYSKTK